MNTKSSLKVKPAAMGKVDPGFYIDRAHKLRAEYFETSIENLKSWLKSHIQQVYSKLFISGKPLHH